MEQTDGLFPLRHHNDDVFLCMGGSWCFSRGFCLWCHILVAISSSNCLSHVRTSGSSLNIHPSSKTFVYKLLPFHLSSSWPKSSLYAMVEGSYWVGSRTMWHFFVLLYTYSAYMPHNRFAHSDQTDHHSPCLCGIPNSFESLLVVPLDKEYLPRHHPTARDVLG